MNAPASRVENRSLSQALPLLLLPGTVCDARLFEPLMAELDHPDMRVMDMTGADTTSELARKLLAKAPSRFALLGFSLGGIVALEMMAQAPERVERLALIDTTPRPDPEANAKVRRNSVEKARKTGMDSYILDAWEKLVSPANVGDEKLKEVIADMARQAGADVLAAQSEVAIFRADSRDRLKAIKVPTLVLAGEDEQICPLSAHEEIAGGIADARFFTIPHAGHFAPLENPADVARHMRDWLAETNAHHAAQAADQGVEMSANDSTGKGKAMPATGKEEVLQVERHDYVDLAPTDRPRSQSMEGFDDIYTDIVDYIIRCTHKIWDERDIGLIYTHYTHNCVLYGSSGTIYNREDIVRDTIQRLVSFPERRGMGTQVIWNGNDKEGFFTSHLVTGSGRHTQYGHFGAPTGKPFVSRTIADCMIFQNKIYREWVVADNMAIIQQLGLDPHAFAMRTAKAKFDAGLLSLDIGENRRFVGQTPPAEKADTSLAHNDVEAQTIEMLHEIFVKRMFGRITQDYAPNAQYHGPLMKELYGHAAIIHQHLGLIGSLPDASYEVQHVASNPCDEGGTKVAVRWIMEGHHLGYGILGTLGDPTGKRVQVMGMSHYHWKNGKIVDEWTVYDEMSLLTQVKLGQLADGAELE
ncbi:pimeloyl-ACP methyl ester carboxylesterase/predicted ester cyclase [Devosia subaequoris]|uniref:Pimeloyl-ACP methyl ester carboxylesterase/predicted ester cyclase n=1 Tax=Devosia subaequoris TaxID=395930 RepID=A0A7W6NBU7_9HYPH|nr:alpha/beta fold hydrolase [Devosia subaequoris]MBB4052061.1 pimeloyl-ACP methyl ester carboxylesterase/predicted ester cyclase [Devosia subaequoris]MCP1210224.1 alpha/beta fold hydrolase [Devosia subaequoris]